MTTPHVETGFRRQLSWFDATLLVVGTMIGSGIFIVSADIARDVGSAGWLLVVWLLTAMMTLLGAACYAELSARLPWAGGQYVYLREAWNPLSAFLYGWTCFLVIQTGSIAAVAVAFAKFLGVLVPALGIDPDAGAYTLLDWPDFNRRIALPLPWRDEPWVIWQKQRYSITAGHLVAVCVIATLTAINCLGVREGKWVQNIFTISKVAALVLLIVAGLLMAVHPYALEANLHDLWSGVFDTPRYQEVSQLVPWPTLAALMVVIGAMVGALFAADAWNNITFTALEVQDPQRNLPRSLLTGVGFVMVIYILTNIVYLVALPVRADPNLENYIRTTQQRISELTAEGRTAEAQVLQRELEQRWRQANTLERGIARVLDDRVGTAVLEQVSPRFGVSFMALAVMISTFGCVNGMTLMGARLYYAMAQDGLFFAVAGRLNQRGVPAAGLILQGIWASILVFSGTYSELLDFVIFAVLLFYATTVAGLFIIRRKHSAEPPFRVWGYPGVPIFYIACCTLIMLDLLIVRPNYTWPGLFIVLSGIPVYYLWRLLGRHKLEVSPG
ncbi:MAG: amino acid permease [Gemmatales bacterium]|nr:amino acid permease [Gemmatales bacterium]MDW7995860.1 amino acid permease [Gemmatales bacterium]